MVTHPYISRWCARRLRPHLADRGPDGWVEPLRGWGRGCVVSRVDQTIFVGDPKRKGNCVAACVASILDEPLDRVPHFIEFGIAYGDSEDVQAVSSGNNWWAMMLGYLAARGWWVAELEAVTDADPEEFVLVAGPSPRGVMHQVIYRGGRLWHDPHPSRDGVLDVREVLAVRPLPGFDHEPTGGDDAH